MRATTGEKSAWPGDDKKGAGEWSRLELKLGKKGFWKCGVHSGTRGVSPAIGQLRAGRPRSQGGLKVKRLYLNVPIRGRGRPWCQFWVRERLTHWQAQD